MNKIKEVLRAAGFEPYPDDYSGSNLSTIAEQLTYRRTPYFSKETRRSFGCRVLRLETLFEGAAIGAIESLDWVDDKKVYRGVLVDFTGHVERTEKFNTLVGAKRGYKEMFSPIEPVNLVSAALLREEQDHRRHLRNLESALKTLLYREPD